MAFILNPESFETRNFLHVLQVLRGFFILLGGFPWLTAARRGAQVAQSGAPLAHSGARLAHSGSPWCAKFPSKPHYCIQKQDFFKKSFFF